MQKKYITFYVLLLIVSIVLFACNGNNEKQNANESTEPQKQEENLGYTKTNMDELKRKTG